MNDLAAEFFKCTDRERAIFEAGIKLGSIYHQYVGMPINNKNVDSAEKAIMEGVKVQPFISEASVKIRRDSLKSGEGTYSYQSLTGEMMDVEISVKYGNDTVTARMSYIEKLNYPLMYLED
ncbi:MAG: dihydroneopterin aldolase family protein [Candidatus Thermoplasmatota archaeon]|nr:dihydroneopterin aldolase family protein [Candidatus Thermoplasmatota archaeon]